MSEPFWYIYANYRPAADANAAGAAGGGQHQAQQQPSCEFKWARDRLFDRDVATMLYEAAAQEPVTATVMQVGEGEAVGHGCQSPPAAADQQPRWQYPQYSPALSCTRGGKILSAAQLQPRWTETAARQLALLGPAESVCGRAPGRQQRPVLLVPA